MRRPILVALALACSSAFASEGVVEINQNSALAGGVTPGDGPGFPVRLGLPGSYRLTSNLDLDTGAKAIEVTVPDVVIDLAGFSILGPLTCKGSGSSIDCGGLGVDRGISAFNVDRVEVRNGIVRGFNDNAIRLGHHGVVEDVFVSECATNGISCGDHCSVRNVRATRCAFAGISTGDASTVSGSSAEGNGDAGIIVNNGARAFGNTSRSNGGDGIRANRGCVIESNASRSNGTNGIKASSDGLVRGNAVSENLGYGLSLSSNVGYSQNTIQAPAGATGLVLGGVNLGQNSCNDALCP